MKGRDTAGSSGGRPAVERAPTHTRGQSETFEAGGARPAPRAPRRFAVLTSCAVPSTPSPPVPEPSRSPAPALSRNVLALGWTSLLTDISSEMIVPVLP